MTVQLTGVAGLLPCRCPHLLTEAGLLSLFLFFVLRVCCVCVNARTWFGPGSLHRLATAYVGYLTSVASLVVVCLAVCAYRGSHDWRPVTLTTATQKNRQARVCVSAKPPGEAHGGLMSL